MTVAETARAARQAGTSLVAVGAERRTRLLRELSQVLEQDGVQERILAANQADVVRLQSTQGGTQGAALSKRLALDPGKLNGLAQGLRKLAELPDPLGEITVHRALDQGLILQRQRCPLGVVGVVFEARPDAVVQIAGLSFRSGNAILLKGGSEALESNRALTQVLHEVLRGQRLDPALVTLLEERADVLALLNLEHLVDLIVARGSSSFVQYVREHSTIPVMAHSQGICHLYLHRAANPSMAARLAVDSKVSYPAACNAVETLLWDRDAAAALDACVAALSACGVELRGCSETRARHPELNPADEQDWDTEYGALILSIRCVDEIGGALRHIEAHGSRHTEAIVTEDREAAQHFLREVDAACVFHNASTRFSDGYRFGLGAELGISTDKLGARGPVGFEGLLTQRWLLCGQGHVSADYGPGQRSFLHRDLPLRDSPGLEDAHGQPAGTRQT